MNIFEEQFGKFCTETSDLSIIFTFTIYVIEQSIVDLHFSFIQSAQYRSSVILRLAYKRWF